MGKAVASGSKATVASGARAWTIQWAEVGWLGQSVHMNVCALSMELHIAASGSLKAKRAVIKHLIETSKVRFGVAAAEVDFHDQWQRTEIGFAAVGSSPGHVEDVLDSVERFVWSHPELTDIGSSRSWLDTEQ